MAYMKAFFEEYGLVLVVTIIATGMIGFSNDFKVTLGEAITETWQKLVMDAS